MLGNIYNISILLFYYKEKIVNESNENKYYKTYNVYAVKYFIKKENTKLLLKNFLIYIHVIENNIYHE